MVLENPYRTPTPSIVLVGFDTEITQFEKSGVVVPFVGKVIEIDAAGTPVKSKVPAEINPPEAALAVDSQADRLSPTVQVYDPNASSTV